MNKGVIALLVAVIAVVAITVVKFVFLDNNPDLVGPKRIEEVPVPKPESKKPEQEPEPRIRYPVSEIQVDVETRAMPERKPEPLPPLTDSDAPLRQALTDMDTSDRLAGLIVFDSVIRRFVVTVDNMTREKLPQKYRLVEDVPGGFMVAKTDDAERYLLNPENYERYAAFVDLFEAVNLRVLVRIYSRFYPLFQQAYEDLGYPDRYFNDRLIEVIDELLATPRVEEPVELVRPKVFYKFADPELEALPAGQKILIRMGPVNGERVKARLKELRRLLVRG